MSERTRSTRETSGSGPSGFDDIVGGTGPGAGSVNVSHGVHNEPLPMAGRTVGEIRRRYADRFDIPPGADAELDGQYVSDDTTVSMGQTLLFANHSGEKGLSVGSGRPVGERGS
jgi:hypothetical protein